MLDGVPKSLRNDGPDWEDGFSFDCLNQALGPASPAFPSAVAYRDASNPFTIDATLGQWQISGSGSRVHIHIAGGMLQDADKGAFPLSGLVIAMRLALKMEPVEVVNPGVLSELQQVGLLDAVSTYLNDSGVRYTLVTVDVEIHPDGKPPAVARVTGLLAVQETSAAVVIPGGTFLAQAVIPNLAPRKPSDLESALLSWSVSLVADKVVAVAGVSWPDRHGAESTTSTVTCSHAAHYDALGRTLAFVPDPNPVIRHGAAVPAGEELRFQRMVDAVQASAGLPRFSFPKISGRSAAWPARETFHLITAGLNESSVYLKGCWS
jgi:hypothetical protein